LAGTANFRACLRFIAGLYYESWFFERNESHFAVIALLMAKNATTLQPKTTTRKAGNKS
jgi:hypothetical protein